MGNSDPQPDSTPDGSPDVSTAEDEPTADCIDSATADCTDSATTDRDDSAVTDRGDPETPTSEEAAADGDRQPAATGDDGTDRSAPGHAASLSRRGTLASVLGVAGLGLLSGSAAGDATTPRAAQATPWTTDVDANDHRLFDLGALELRDDPTIEVTDGTAMEWALDGERCLRVVPTEPVRAPTIVGGHRSNAAPDCTGATIGGGRTNEVGDDFGTVGGGAENEAAGISTTVGGGSNNTAAATHTAVCGGLRNEATGTYATVGGGWHNEATAYGATVAGGASLDSADPEPTRNRVVDDFGTVGGGSNNAAGCEDEESAAFATVAGGVGNTAGDERATVGGGNGNEAVGPAATVPGGSQNRASGGKSFAAGDHAEASGHVSFVWNDGSAYHDVDCDDEAEGFSSARDVAGSGVTGNHTFHVSARNGARFVTGESSVTYLEGGSAGWATTSTRTAKTNVDPVDPEAVLEGVGEMEIATWEYRDGDGEGQGVRHVGPMAEEFHDVLDVGDSDEHINSIDADGVALASVQGLARRLEEREARIDEQCDRIADLEAENETLRERAAALEDRLDGLAAHVDDLEAGLDDPVGSTDGGTAGDS